MNKYKAAFNRLLNGLTPICEKYHKNRYYFLADALWGFIRYGITPNEYLGFQFYKLSSLERKRFFTARHSDKWETKFNDPQFYDVFCRKELTNKKFAKFLSRDWIYTPDASAEEIKDFLKRHPKVIVKPTNLSSGRGVHIFKNETIENLKGDDYLLEEFVEQNPLMTEINPSSVNTVRCYTLLPKQDKEVHPKDVVPIILSISIRGGGKDAEVDNYHSGGVGYPVDIDNGIVYRPGTDIAGREYLFHPSTGKKMIGFQIPMYDTLKSYIQELCSVVPSARLVGWDLAVTQDGFELIEANYLADPGFMQAPSKEGKLKIIKQQL